MQSIYSAGIGGKPIGLNAYLKPPSKNKKIYILLFKKKKKKWCIFVILYNIKTDFVLFKKNKKILTWWNIQNKLSFLIKLCIFL